MSEAVPLLFRWKALACGEAQGVDADFAAQIRDVFAPALKPEERHRMARLVAVATYVGTPAAFSELLVKLDPVFVELWMLYVLCLERGGVGRDDPMVQGFIQSSLVLV